MSTQGESRFRPYVWYGVALIAALLGLAAGLGIASTLRDSENADLKSLLRETREQLSQVQSEVQGLQADLEKKESASQTLVKALEQAGQREDDLKEQLSRAAARASSALEELDHKSTELADLEQAQSETRSDLEKLQVLKSISGSLESTRGLLVEVRKDLPQTREGAFTYWSKVKSLAAKADPTLVSPVDRIILRIDNYFDWNDSSPGPGASSDEQFTWLVDYTLSGAVAYEDAARSFAKDTLLTVITRIDLVVGYLE